MKNGANKRCSETMSVVDGSKKSVCVGSKSVRSVTGGGNISLCKRAALLVKQQASKSSRPKTNRAPHIMLQEAEESFWPLYLLYSTARAEMMHNEAGTSFLPCGTEDQHVSTRLRLTISRIDRLRCSKS